MNRLFYGDNLDVLESGKIPSESVDLIYLDPPFNSQREYNQFMREADGSLADSQQQAFLDSWDWTQAADTYEALRRQGDNVAEIVQALHTTMGPSNTLAYLVMMAERLVALRRVLKPTGSIYLHCDPTASHYLKILMDAIYGSDRFINEIIWKRSTAHSDKAQGSRHFGRLHDVILLYSKSDAYVWNQQYEGHDPKYLASHYSRVDDSGRRYRLDNLTGPGGAAKGNPSYEVMGVTRYWRYSREKMTELIKAGRIVQTKPGGVPQYKRYLDESLGRPLQDTWTDIAPLNSQAKERKRVGFPTQKPLSLMERIIRVSSNEGDVVLDPFCGCGTTIAAAQRLQRRWTGIDITARAIDIIVERLRREHPGIESTYKIEQYPYSVTDALRLGKDNKFHFQRWALERLGVDPSQIKPGADKGIDGRLFFSDGASGRTKRVVFSVKAGQRVGAQDVRDLRGVLDRDGFEIGILVTIEALTPAAQTDMASGRRFYEASDGHRYRRLQHITVAEMFKGKRADYPGAKDATRASQALMQAAHEATLPLDFNKEPEFTLQHSQQRKSKMVKASLPLGFREAQPRKPRRRA